MCHINPIVKILARNYNDDIKRKKVNKTNALLKLECIKISRISYVEPVPDWVINENLLDIGFVTKINFA